MRTKYEPIANEAEHNEGIWSSGMTSLPHTYGFIYIRGPEKRRSGVRSPVFPFLSFSFFALLPFCALFVFILFIYFRLILLGSSFECYFTVPLAKGKSKLRA